MWIGFGLGVFVGVLFGIFVIGMLTAGKIEDVREGRDTPK